MAASNAGTTQKSDGLRRIKYGHWGLAEDPVGQFVTWTIRDRQYLGEVVATYRREFPSGIMLKVRHFDGSDAPDVGAACVYIIGQSA